MYILLVGKRRESERAQVDGFVGLRRTNCLYTIYIYVYIISGRVGLGPAHCLYIIYIYVCMIRGLVGLSCTNCLDVVYVYAYRIRQFILTYVQLYHDTCLRLCWSAPRELPVYVYVYIVRGLFGLHRANANTSNLCCPNSVWLIRKDQKFAPAGVLQCVAVCCSVLQCVAVCCSVLQCVAVCCNVLQCVAVCCNVLQCVASQFAPAHAPGRNDVSIGRNWVSIVTLRIRKGKSCSMT